MIETGTLLQNRYLIEKQIGAGGMGAVYLAVDQRFNNHLAIKETFHKHDELGDAFEREARLLNSLHHPVLPHVSDYFTEAGGHFLVMQFIEGEDLSAILKRQGAFPVPYVMGWMKNLLDALDYLHSQESPIIHRDIKPHNLKLSPRGDVILLDFGLAKLNAEDTTGAISVFGYSRTYSPLEQIQGTGTDPRSDIFALGATVYHLLTGKPPIDALARAAAIVNGKSDPLLLASEMNSEIPVGVANVLNSALALNPDQRFVSAKAMRQALEHAVSIDSTQNAEELPQPVLVAAPTENGVVNSAETENFPALEAFADKVKNLLEPDILKNARATHVQPDDEAALPIPFADKVKSLFQADVTENLTDVTENLTAVVVQPDKETKSLPAPETFQQENTFQQQNYFQQQQQPYVSEVTTKVAPRKKPSRLPLAALAPIIIFVALAAGYFINKANSPNESVQNPVVQPLQESNVNINQPAAVTNLPVPQVSESPQLENIEQAETKPAFMEKTAVKRQTVQKQKSKDEPPASAETIEKPEPARAKASPRPAERQTLSRSAPPQHRSQTSPHVVVKQPFPDIESIFTGRPAGKRSEKLRRKEERRQQPERINDEEYEDLLRRQKRRERQNRRSFPPF